MIAKHTVRWWRLAGALALLLGLAAGASGQPVISGSLPSTTDVGATYLSAPVQLVTGGTPPYTWTLSTTLLWLNFNPDGTATVSGTPSTAGEYSITASVTDSTTPVPLASLPVTFNIKVNPAVQITAASLPAGQQGVAYPVTTLAATGGTGSYTWSLASGSPPPGLTLAANGSIGPGPPTAVGTFPFTAQVTDGLTTATQPFSITIAPPPLAVLTTSLPSGEAGAPYTASPSATGGVPPYTWSITGLPAGLTFSSSTGVISGPLAANATTSTTVVIQVTDSSPTTVSSAPLTLTVTPGLTISTPAALPNGEATVAYSQTLVATGGSGTGYTWAVTSGSLPTGLSLSAGGAITGTPTTAGGPFNFTAKVTDSLGGSASLVFSLTITAGPSISPSSLPNGEVTAPYSQTLAATGGSGSGYTYSITSGSPPTGLSLNAAGTISGTPTAAGPSTFTVQVTDSAGGKGTQNFTLTVIAAPNITSSATLPQGEVGAAYSQTLAASGGSGSGYTWSLTGGSLPEGLSLSAGGVLSGTPGAAALGTTSFTVQVTDSAKGTATLTLSITIIAGPTITTAPALPNGTVGVAYTTVTLSASDGTPPYIWSIITGSLPPGLSLDPNAGTITGTPTASGTSNFTVQVKDAKNVTATKPFSITVAAGLNITTAPELPHGTIGISYTVTLAAAGGTPPYTFSVISGSLPNGLTLNSSTGEIKGFPASSGSFLFTAQVTDSASVTSTKAFTLTVAAALAFTTPPTLPSGAIGVLYSQPLIATGGTPSYTFLITAGALPNGLSLSSVSNLITGTPVSSGTFNFTVQVRDSNGVTASQTFSLTIAAGLVISTPSPLPQGAVNSAYSQALAAAGGVAPYVWTLAQGTLPPGLSLSGGIISGTPASNGTSTFTIRVTDNAGASATKQFTLTISAGLAITSGAALPSGTLGQAYPAFTLAAVGGNKPYAWSVSAGAMPAGLSLSSSGVITGTPSATGSFTFTLQVKDSTGATATQIFTISIVPPTAPTVTVPGEPTASPAGQQVSFGVSLAAPYALDITGQITLSFEPNAVAAATDPALQFSTGGLTANYTIPANSLNAVFSNSSQKIGLQTGTVSGTITLTFTLTAAGAELPGLQNTIIVSRSAPVIESVKLVRTSAGLEVHVIGFSPPRDLTEADLTFTAAPGSTLQTTTVTENISSVATAWYQSTASGQYGSLFMLVLPFTASTGSVDAVGSVSVVLKNAEGTAPSLSGTY